MSRRESNQNSGKREITGKIHVQGEVLATIPKELLSRYEEASAKADAREDVAAKRDAKRFKLEIATLLFVLVATAITTIQTAYVRQTLEATRQQFAIDQRPYVVTEMPVLGSMITLKEIKFPIVGEPLDVGIQLKNVGKSPALALVIRRYVAFGQVAEASFRAKRTPNVTPSRQVLFPGMPVVTTAISQRDPLHNVGVGIKDADRVLWDGTYPIIFYGNIYYQDASGNQYCTEFADKFLQSTGSWSDISGINRDTCENL